MSRRSRSAESPPRSSRRGGRDFPVLAILLIIAGVILLLQTTGVFPWDLWINLWRFWPLLVIALGVYILLGRRMGWWATVLVVVAVLVAVGGALVLGSGKEQPVTTTTETLENLTSVGVHIVFGAGDLNVGSLPAGSPNLVEGRFGEGSGQGANVHLSRSGTAGELNISMDRRPWVQWFSKASWNLGLSQTPLLSIDVDSGASDAKLDLRDLKVTKLDLAVGAANVDVIMPANAGNVTVEINAGAADITITVPPDVAAKIHKSSGLSSFVVDGGRFPLSGDDYVSPHFDAAKNRVTIDLNVGAASVTIK